MHGAAVVGRPLDPAAACAAAVEFKGHWTRSSSAAAAGSIRSASRWQLYVLLQSIQSLFWRSRRRVLCSRGSASVSASAQIAEYDEHQTVYS